MALSNLNSAYLDSLDYVLPRRQKELDYIKRVHTGAVHWLNTIKLDKQLIMQLFQPQKLVKRTQRWLVLGLSLGRILELSNLSIIARAVLQLIDEYEYYCSHAASNSNINENKMNLIFPHRKPPIQQRDYQKVNDNEPIKSTLHKINRVVAYEFLLLPFQQLHQTAQSMDYCEIVYSLCDVLNLLYSRCLEDSIAINNNNIKDAIIKFDKSIKKLFIGKICADLTEIATQVMQKEMLGLLNHVFIDQSRSNKILKRYYQLETGKGKGENKEQDDFFTDSDKE
jgi:hypothetical protein